MHDSEFYSLFLLWKKKQFFVSVSRLRNLSIVYVSIWTVPRKAWIYHVSYFTVYSCAGKFNNFDVWLITLLISSRISLYVSCLSKNSLVRSIIIWFKENFYITRVFLWMFVCNFQKIGLIIKKTLLVLLIELDLYVLT